MANCLPATICTLTVYIQCQCVVGTLGSSIATAAKSAGFLLYGYVHCPRVCAIDFLYPKFTQMGLKARKAHQ